MEQTLCILSSQKSVSIFLYFLLRVMLWVWWWAVCYCTGPWSWFPDSCCRTVSFEPAASPSFLQTTCQAESTAVGIQWEASRNQTAQRRGCDWSLSHQSIFQGIETLTLLHLKVQSFSLHQFFIPSDFIFFRIWVHVHLTDLTLHISLTMAFSFSLRSSSCSLELWPSSFSWTSST